jgi:hypothetical protein
MPKPVLSIRVRERIGHDAADDLAAALEANKDAMLIASQERFEARLASGLSGIRQEMATLDAGLRVSLAEGLSKIRMEMADMRVDVLRWSFLFWIGQVVATATIMTVLLRAFAR